MTTDTQQEKTPQEIFLKDLRTQTHTSHQALEDNDISKAILSEAVTVKDYQTYLSKMYGLKKGLEKDVYPMLSELFTDLADRKKSHLIEQDLLHTGMSKEAIAEIPVKHFAPANRNEALGTMYVLEGSSLGGRILYKHINKTLGFTEGAGASFFNGYGERTGAMWKSFVTIFTNEAVKENVSQGIIDGAGNTFDAVGQWLSK